MNQRDSGEYSHFDPEASPEEVEDLFKALCEKAAAEGEMVGINDDGVRAINATKEPVYTAELDLNTNVLRLLFEDDEELVTSGYLLLREAHLLDSLYIPAKVSVHVMSRILTASGAELERDRTYEFTDLHGKKPITAVYDVEYSSGDYEEETHRRALVTTSGDETNGAEMDRAAIEEFQASERVLSKDDAKQLRQLIGLE